MNTNKIAERVAGGFLTSSDDWLVTAEEQHCASQIREAASAKAIGKYFKLEKHLKQNGDREGLDLLEEFADALGI